MLRDIIETNVNNADGLAEIIDEIVEKKVDEIIEDIDICNEYRDIIEEAVDEYDIEGKVRDEMEYMIKGVVESYIDNLF